MAIVLVRLTNYSTITKIKNIFCISLINGNHLTTKSIR